MRNNTVVKKFISEEIFKQLASTLPASLTSPIDEKIKRKINILIELTPFVETDSVAVFIGQLIAILRGGIGAPELRNWLLEKIAPLQEVFTDAQAIEAVETCLPTLESATIEEKLAILKGINKLIPRTKSETQERLKNHLSSFSEGLRGDELTTWLQDLKNLDVFFDENLSRVENLILDSGIDESQKEDIATRLRSLYKDQMRHKRLITISLKRHTNESTFSMGVKKALAEPKIFDKRDRDEISSDLITAIQAKTDTRISLPLDLLFEFLPKLDLRKREEVLDLLLQITRNTALSLDIKKVAYGYLNRLDSRFIPREKRRGFLEEMLQLSRQAQAVNNIEETKLPLDVLVNHQKIIRSQKTFLQALRAYLGELKEMSGTGYEAIGDSYLETFGAKKK